MNHAENVKELVQTLLVESDHNGHPLNVEQAEESLQELHAAVDEMQAEIDRAQQSEKEGWRYSNELEQERKAQKAELDTLRAQVPELRGKVQRMESALRDKDAEIDRLKQDADRYRWLRDESWAGYNCSKRKPQVAETIVFVQDGAGNVKTILAEEALDTAIDAAMKERGEGT